MIKWFKTKHKLVSQLVSLIELSQLDEYDATDEASATYFRGCTHGLRAALELIDKKAAPTYDVIRRGKPIKLSFEHFEETGAYIEEPVLEWID